MIKKIKHYFRKRKTKKRMMHEVLETLASICLWLDYMGRHYHNPYTRHMKSHFDGLKHYSEILRKEILSDEQ